MYILFVTAWNTTGSLITLNLSSLDRKIRSEENSYQECESGVSDETLAHDDSGYYGDSDSGVSSLYETINRQEQIQESARHNPIIRQQDEEGQCVNISKDNKKLILQKLNPSLQHIFNRSHRRRNKSDEFGFELDVLEKL